MVALSRAGVLVTGGAGFIGSSLVVALLERGVRRVRVLDDFSTGRRSNLAAISSQIELLEGDLRETEVVAQAVAGMDYVLHQAAIPSVPRSIEAPDLTTDVNVLGTVKLLHAAVQAGVKRVVFASSSSVYGDSDVLPKHEAMPLTTLSPYAASKAAGELFARSFFEVFGLETVCLRYFNIFGPRQDPGSQYAAVIPRFVTSIQQGNPVPVFGDGLQTRDFTFIENVVEANLAACVAPGAAGAVMNIGCGDQISLLELARTMAGVMGRPVSFEHLPARVGDVRHSRADISRAQNLLGYQARFGLREGLEKTVSYFLGL